MKQQPAELEGLLLLGQQDVGTCMCMAWWDRLVPAVV